MKKQNQSGLNRNFRFLILVFPLVNLLQLPATARSTNPASKKQNANGIVGKNYIPGIPDRPGDNGIHGGHAAKPVAIPQKELLFLENKGQVTDQNGQSRTDIQYSISAAAGLNIFIGSGAIHYQFSKIDDVIACAPKDEESYTLYRMDVELAGANKNATVVAAEQQTYCENYRSGREGGNSVAARSYKRITYKDVYPNIDWVLYVRNEKLEYEFVIRKGGKASDIKLKYGGATDLRLAEDGTLTAYTPQGSIAEHAPYTYQEDGAAVASNFRLSGNELRYETGVYSGDLVIDPTIGWATYFGGSLSDNGIAITGDAAGNVYITGNTTSTNNIATTGSYQSTYGGGVHMAGTITVRPLDAYLVKFDGAGNRLWATYYGGYQNDYGNSVAVDASGNVYIAGQTSNHDSIATIGSAQSTFSGGTDAFLAKFSASGAIVWATYFGNGGEIGKSVVIDSSGNIYLAGFGTATATTIATSGAYQTVYGGGNYDAFLAKYNSAGALQWATYYGGSGEDAAYGAAVDPWGNIYISGYTQGSDGIATTGAADPTFSGGTDDAFLAKFNSSGNLLWGTYYGGGGYDVSYGVTTDGAGCAYIAGYTSSTSGIATAGAHQTSYQGGQNDIFVTKFDTSGKLRWGTYYGGTLSDAATGIAADKSGNIFISGFSVSTSGISTAGAFQTSYSGGSGTPCSVFAEFDTSGTLKYGTYFGSSNTAYGVAVDPLGDILLAGSSQNGTIPATTGAYQTASGGSNDAYIVKFGPDFSPVITGPTSYCNGTTGTLHNSTSGGTWTSDNASVATINASTGVVSALATGTSNITYTATTGTATTVVTVGPAPAITGNSYAIILGSTLALSDASTGGTWSSGTAGIASINTSGVVTGNSAGNATISYLTTVGCTATTIVTVMAALSPITGAAAFCQSATITLSDASAGGSWSSSNGNATVGSATGIITGINAGTAMITYIIGTAYVTAVVTVNAGPSFITGPSSVCQGATVTLSNSASGIWSSLVPSVATIGTTTGMVTGVNLGSTGIRFTTASGCQVSYTITVNPAPAAYTGPVSVCMNQAVTMPETGGGTWSNGNAAVGTIDMTSGLFAGIAAGSTTVTYSLGSGCTRNINMVVNALPANITGTTTVCPGATTNLFDATTPANAWISSNTGVATILANGVVTGVTTGTTTISYQINSGCITTTTLTVLAIPQPIAGNGPVCAGSAIVLSDTGSGSWSISNPAIVTVATDGTLTGVAGGAATVTYTAPSGCRTTSSVSVNPLLPITGTAATCIGTNTTLSDATTGGTWSTTDITFATIGTGGIVTGVAAGTASITYTIAGGCARTITVTVNPFALITGATAVCQGSTITLSDAIPGGTWSSSVISVATVVGSTGVVTGVNTGATTISYVASNGCRDTRTITVNAAPGAISGQSAICSGGATTTLTCTGGGTWSSIDPTIISAGSTTGTITGMAAGSTTVVYTLGTGCARGITITSKPIAPITGTLFMCMGAANTLHDATTPSNSWTSSNTGVATILANGVITTVAPGTTTITYTGNNCPITGVLTVNPVPSAGVITAPSTVATTATITATSSGTPGGTWSVSNPHATVDPVFGIVTGQSAGTFTLSYTVATCATVTATKLITESGPAPASHGSSSGVITLNPGSTVNIANNEVSGGEWSSSDNTVATVDDSGFVTGMSAGSANIFHMTTGSGAAATVTNVVVNLIPMNLTMMPNPNKGIFIIKGTTGSHPDEDATLEIINISGQVLHKSMATTSGGLINEQVILNKSMKNGMYLLKITTRSEQKTISFVLER